MTKTIVEQPLTAELPTAGRVLAIDLGEKRIGLALSDPTQTLASSHDVLLRTSRRADFAFYQKLIDQNGVVFVVMGLPVALSGNDSNTTRWVRDYTAELAQQVTVPVTFWNESFSTVQAEQSLRERGLRGSALHAQIDAVAAAFILQDFLDARRRAQERAEQEQAP